MTHDEALTVTWQHLADAEVEHDAEHAARALAVLARLQQRTRDEAPDDRAETLR